MNRKDGQAYHRWRWEEQEKIDEALDQELKLEKVKYAIYNKVVEGKVNNTPRRP